MTYKQFRHWCNERACDGCWGYLEASLCIDVMSEINKLPFWKREKAWKMVKNIMMVEVITPINQRIKEIMGADND